MLDNLEHLNEKGFSLIEAIICMAIMAVLSVSAFSLSGHIKYANTKKCVKQLNQKMETAKMTTMSKAGDWSLYLYRHDGELYYSLTRETFDEDKGTKIGGRKIRLFYKEKGGKESELSGSSKLQIQFARSTGAFAGPTIYESLRIATDSSKGYTIKLVEKTGKHILE
ncbi:type II secretion system protein [[Clostridium] polysaccharolyticum]|uniref:Prepilin-type N-terminal cleavage/methylation domain-containing protein n=1 Tax=[Clostridium] polysaccharolyticum TaxID=29364 RepID=A0A1H9ZRU3_9FIRM|nr:prepilin-type N-terminal cleavage/methylation domain-containing protein [[Clostridium] polysaccharolyticum]SES84337.1 prepilin-type N-terminal cleavage/methylation domain-containing protein [[Clostridium] polysaccharolyticum]